MKRIMRNILRISTVSDLVENTIGTKGARILDLHAKNLDSNRTERENRRLKIVYPLSNKTQHKKRN